MDCFQEEDPHGGCPCSNSDIFISSCQVEVPAALPGLDQKSLMLFICCHSCHDGVNVH